MKLRGGWLALLMALAGCYNPNIQNAGLVCGTGDACPAGYHCAHDSHCWLNGTDPPDGGDDGGADAGGGDQGGGDAGDMLPGMAPPAPTGLQTVPVGPAQSLSPLVKGNAVVGTTVKLYTNASCTGSAAATGSATDFATGLVVGVSANTTTTIAATATDPNNGLTSACSSPVSYLNDITAPAAPSLTGTMPPSPSASDVTPFVLGSAETGAAIKIYTDPACAGVVAATGTAADLAGNGIQITVLPSTTTNIYATAIDAAGNISPCSMPALIYLEDPTLPPAPNNLATNPVSPSKSVTTFHLTGTSVSNTTVTVYTTNNCSGAPVTSGSAATFGGVGFTITVAANSINTFYANATTAANRTGPCSASIKYIEDELPPNIAAAQVRDGVAADIHWQKITDTMDANWSGFADAASGIASYDYNLSTSSMCTGDIVATSNVGLVTTQQSTMLALADGVTYFNCVRAYDAAGNVSGWVASNGVTIDATAPQPGIVRDGTAMDATWTNSPSTMDANWSGFSDTGGSGISSFDYNLSSTPACSGDVLIPVSLSAATLSYHANGLALTNGTTYYNCVRATDVAGNVGAWVASNGITLDDVPPVDTAATVRDGLGADIQYQSSTTSLSGNWSGFTDALSLIASYEVNVSTSNACAGDVMAATSVGSLTHATLAVSISSSVTYFFCVRARDNANNVSNWVSSNGVTIDTSAPTGGTVRDGAVIGLDVQWQTTTASIDGNWTGFVDDSGSIASYDWNVSTTNACTGNIVATQNTAGTNRGASGLTLTNGTKYFNCVRARDAAGNVGAFVASDGVRVDIDLPTTGVVHNGVAGDFAWTKVINTDAANWSGFNDATSGIGSYDHNLSTNGGCTGDVLPNLNLMALNTSRAVAPPLQDGHTYFNCVRANDVAGNQSAFVASSSFTVDITPPSTAGAALLDGSSGPDAQYQTSLTSTSVRWSGFTDAGGSGVANYDWGLSTASDCSTQVTSISGIGSSGSFTANGLSLTNGQKYYNCIRAVDLAGNLSAWAVSDGVTADNQAPTTAGAVVHDGLTFPPDLQYQQSNNQLTANWSGFTDNVGIASYLYNVSSMTNCNGNIAAPQSTAGLSATINVGLVNATKYFVCVAAVDLAGNPSAYVPSDGVTVDTAAPASGTVRDGAGADLQFQQSTTQMTANWINFSDAISGIASYNYALSTQSNCTTPLTTMSLASVSGSGSITVSVGLSDGVPYYNCVQAVDAVGNAGPFVASNGVTIDADKPTGGAVADGPGPGDVAFSASTSSMSSTWSGFTDGAGSGIASYNWQLTTTSNCSGGPIAAVSAIALPAHLQSGLALTNGTTYYNCVAAVDNVGNVGDWVPSNGVTVDNQPPSTGSAMVGDGTAVGDIAWQNQTHGAGANWTGFSDGGGSGIASYDYNLSTSNTCSGDVVAPTNVGLVTSYSWNNAGVTLLSNGTFYFSCVRAHDTAGNVSGWLASNGFRVDVTAPTLATVKDGSVIGSDAAWTNDATRMSANWTAVTDSQSGVGYYEWGLSTLSDCSAINVVGPLNETLALSVFNQAAGLGDGATYYNCVRATDVAGNISGWSPSNGIKVDLQLPVGTVVNDGPGPGDVQWWGNKTSVSANWAAFTDNSGSIQSYDWELSTAANCMGVIIASANGLSGALTSTTQSVTLNEGVSYTQCVRATDPAGNHSAYLASNGFTVDSVAPSQPGAVTILPGNRAVTLAWGAATDASSGVASYDIFMCSTTGCTPATFVTNVSTLGSAVSGLANCATYGFAVRAIDNAGNVGALSPTVYGSPVIPAPSPITAVPGAARIEYSFPPVANATSYEICYGSMLDPCASGTVLSTSYASGFLESLPLTTKHFNARAIDTGCTSPGTSAVFAPVFSPTAFYNTPGSATNNWLGYQVAMVGDVDGDGKSDFAVSYGFGGGGTHGSNLAVQSGATGVTLWSISGPNGLPGPFPYFGSVMGTGGDVDGDGYPDLLVGAPTAGFDAASANQGAWYLFSGHTGTQLCVNWPTSATSPPQGQQVGGSLQIIPNVNGPDVNGVLRASFIIGGPGVQFNGTSFGGAQVWTYTGSSPGGTCAPFWGISDTTGGTRMGSGVASTADVDGDGVPDVAISVPNIGTAGVVHVYSGKTGAGPIMGFDAIPPAPNTVSGAIATGGDIDGDGKIDLLVGYKNGAAGGVGVYSGKDNHAIWSFNGTATAAPSWDNFGSLVGPAGDVNGDGYADFFVAANNAKISGVASVGAVYVYSGLNAGLLYEIDGTGVNEQFGLAAAGGGDINGDGRPDLVLGGPFLDCNGAGSRCGGWWVYGPNSELGVSPGEFASPFYGQGYFGLQTPITGGPSIALAATGGAGGSYTYNLLTSNSGGSVSVAGVYSPGATSNVLDTVRITDSAHRTFDTRVWAKPIAGMKPNIGRPFSLKSTGTGNGTVSLSWTQPVGTNPVLEYRTATQAWSSISLAAGTSTYLFTGTATTQYRFRVKAQKANLADSMWSSELTAATGP